MGHAIYSVSDPRAEIFKQFVEQLAKEKGREEEYALYAMVECMAPQVIGEKRKIYKGVNANVDFYAGSSGISLHSDFCGGPYCRLERPQTGRAQECR